MEPAAWHGKQLLSVACGDGHTAAVLDDGALFTFGRGDDGNLGHGDKDNQTSPKRVELAVWHGKRVLSVACGGSHTAAVLDDGTLFTFGDGSYGQLGHGDKEQQPLPKCVELVAWLSKRVMSVACGLQHTAAVFDGGALFTFGRGDDGQLGHGDKANQTSPKCVELAAWQGKRVISVACCKMYTATVLDDGSLFTFGRGNEGQLGHGDKDDRLKPTRVQLGATTCAKPPPQHVIGVAFFKSHAAAWTRDGCVFCWGADASYGKLGGVGASTVAGRTGGAVTAGDSSVVLSSNLPREVAGLPHIDAGGRCRRAAADRVVDVVCGPDHSTYARTRDGSVFAWGRGLGGQLGLGATERDHDLPRLMGPVQGRVVTGVFVAHDGAVWLSCAADGARAERGHGTPPCDARNPLVLFQGTGADLEAGASDAGVLASAVQSSGTHGSSAEV